MKILVICEYGNIRSVSLAYLLKRLYKHDAIACGTKANHIDTIRYLCEWADKIIIVERHLRLNIDTKYHKKIQVVEIGPDVWHQVCHPNLMDKIYKVMAEQKEL